jgi:hypothetical protein
MEVEQVSLPPNDLGSGVRSVGGLVTPSTGVVAGVAAKPKVAAHAPRMAQLRDQIGNLTDAIASDGPKGSLALAGRLTAAETELATLTAEATKPAPKVVDFPARLTARLHKLVVTDRHIGARA